MTLKVELAGKRFWSYQRELAGENTDMNENNGF